LTDPDRDRYPGLADPDPADPDRYKFQAGSTCIFDFFPEHFNMLYKILKIMTPFSLMRKKKHSKLALL
jgi:hypothetical protein